MCQESQRLPRQMSNKRSKKARQNRILTSRYSLWNAGKFYNPPPPPECNLFSSNRCFADYFNYMYKYLQETFSIVSEW